MKILVITPRFAIAGVPLAQIRLARALNARGHSVELVIGHIHKDYDLVPPEGIKTTILKQPTVRRMFWPLFRYFLTERPDVVFAAEDHLNIVVLMAALFARSQAKISGSCRVTPFDTYSSIPLTKGWFLKKLAQLFMDRADALTCVSKDMVIQYQQVFSSPPHVCVYNIVADNLSRKRMNEIVEHAWFKKKSVPVLVAAGRLAPWKGFSDLIEAMALLKDRRNVRLVILGDGPLRNELQELIGKRGLEDNIELVGYVDNPLKYFSHANVFVLSSLVEGLPNVLVEAMMCGCTPVSTDCPTGPREVLCDGQFGFLSPVRNPPALASAIEQALDNPIDPRKLNEAVMPFEENAVLDRHFEVLGLHG